MATMTKSSGRDRLVDALGLASVALSAPLAVPGRVAEAIGVGSGERQKVALAGIGARELAAAAGLLGLRHPAFLWARVGGDAMDISMLARAMRGQARRHQTWRHQTQRYPTRAIATGAALAAITAVDVYAAVSRSSRRRTIETTGSVTVGKEPGQVYDFWRHLQNLPSFMQHVEQVEVDGRRSHWRVSGPAGRSVEWDAETVADRPGERIEWRSLDDADIRNEGTVSFRPAPGGRGTEVHVRLRYELPGGRVGQGVARVLGEDPRQQLDDDLRRLKQVMETGEVVRSDGAPDGKRARHEFPQHPARPLSDAELEEVLG